jgi:serine/threonine protein kinase
VDEKDVVLKICACPGRDRNNEEKQYKTLGQKVARNVRRPKSQTKKCQTIEIFRQIFQALKYLSKHKMASRKINPWNILVSKDVIKLAEFSISRVAKIGKGEDYRKKETFGLLKTFRKKEL